MKLLRHLAVGLACLLAATHAFASGYVYPVAHTSQHGTGTQTTTAINTTGASLLTASVSWLCNGAPTVSGVSDSKSNTWTGGTVAGPGTGSTCVRIWYAQNPTVGASHTFTVTASGGSIFATVTFQAWAAIATPTSFDTQNTNTTTTGTTIQPGTLTPTGLDLIYTAVAPPDAATFTWAISGGNCQVIDALSYAAGVAEGGGAAWCVSSGSLNPAWSSFTSGAASAAIAGFTLSANSIASSKTNDYAVMTAGTAANISASKTNDYPVLNAGHAGQVSASKSNVYVVLQALHGNAVIFHSFPP